MPEACKIAANVTMLVTGVAVFSKVNRKPIICLLYGNNITSMKNYYHYYCCCYYYSRVLTRRIEIFSLLQKEHISDPLLESQTVADSLFWSWFCTSDLSSRCICFSVSPECSLLFPRCQFAHKRKPQCQPIGPHLRNLDDRSAKQRMNRSPVLQYGVQTAHSLKDALSHWFRLK